MGGGWVFNGSSWLLNFRDAPTHDEEIQNFYFSNSGSLGVWSAAPTHIVWTIISTSRNQLRIAFSRWTFRRLCWSAVIPSQFREALFTNDGSQHFSRQSMDSTSETRSARDTTTVRWTEVTSDVHDLRHSGSSIHYRCENARFLRPGSCLKI
jgi:hypothetical protein